MYLPLLGWSSVVHTQYASDLDCGIVMIQSSPPDNELSFDSISCALDRRTCFTSFDYTIQLLKMRPLHFLSLPIHLYFLVIGQVYTSLKTTSK